MHFFPSTPASICLGNPITGKRPPRSRMSTLFVADSVKEYGLPSSASTVMRRIKEMSVRAMPPHSVLLVWCRIKTFPHVGHRASLLVTPLVMSWKSHVMLKQRAYLLPNARSEGSVLFHAVSLRDLPRFHLFSWSLIDLLFVCGGKQCDYDEHNMWNPMLFFCHDFVGTDVESYFDEIVWGRIALSCHFALDLLCDKADVHVLRLARASVGSLAWL